jgi:hypothetical protein
MDDRSRVTVQLDEQGIEDLIQCTVAMALERDGENVTHSKVVRMALRKWADTLDLPEKLRRGRAKR